MKPLKTLTRISLALAFFASCHSIAQDNPSPSSWATLTVKTSETYGNNQSRSLNQAKVTVEYSEPQKAANYFAKHNVSVRIPQSKTSNTRGAIFSRLPPSNLVGKYKITVEPQKQGCNTQTKEVHLGNSKKNITFEFTCYNSSQGAPKATRATQAPKTGDCHRVRISPANNQAPNYKNVYAESCLQADGSWLVKPYRI